MATQWEVELSMVNSFQVVLQDERNPAQRYCPVCLLVYPRLLGGNAPVIPLVQTQHHGFLDVCIRNISVPLSAQERRDLRRRLQDNMEHCVYLRLVPGKSHARKLEEYGFAHVEDPVDIHRGLICQLLSCCLHSFDKTAASPRSIVDRAWCPQKRFRSAKGTWPIRVAQLFPYGETETVDGIVDCCSSLACEQALHLLSAILDLTRPRVWSRLISDRNRSRLTWTIATIILLAIPGSDENLPAAPAGCRLPRRWKTARWLQNGDGLWAAIHLLDTIKTGNYARPDDELEFSRDSEAMLISAYRLALQHYRTTNPDVRRSLGRSLATLQKATEAPLMTTEDLVRYVEHQPRCASVVSIVKSAMWWLDNDRRCAGPHCTLTMLDRIDEEDKPLSVCARCKLMRYCSKQCQQGDWTLGQPVPHKRLCPVLAQLHAAGDPRGSDRDYRDAIQQRGMSDEQIALAGRWALSRGRVMQNSLRASIGSASNTSSAP